MVLSSFQNKIFASPEMQAKILNPAAGTCVFENTSPEREIKPTDKNAGAGCLWRRMLP
jgi:hypothetical protein